MKLVLIIILISFSAYGWSFKDVALDNAIKQYLWTESGAILNVDIHFYINEIANTMDSNYELFVIDDHTINAFATQYGMIGIHQGLIVSSDNEEELLSVITHEMGHIHLKHFDRLAQRDRGDLLALGGLVLAGASKNSELSQAIISSTIASKIQTTINWTRRFEVEADNFAKKELKAKGMNSNAMSNFFLRLKQSEGTIEYLQTHPLSINRAIRSYTQENIEPKPDSEYYTILKATLQEDNTHPYIEALKQYTAGNFDLALELLTKVTQISSARILKGRILTALGKYEQAIALLSGVSELGDYYLAKALYAKGEVKQAIALLKTKNYFKPNYYRYLLLEEMYTEQKQIDKYYMTVAERHILMGDITTAKINYNLAKSETQNLDLKQKIEARLMILENI